jgi:Helix-hairpin-helix domain
LIQIIPPEIAPPDHVGRDRLENQVPDQTVADDELSAPELGARVARRGPDLVGPNARIADKFSQAADILAAQGADPFRIAAYRRAADSIRALNDDLGAIADKGGLSALEAIPAVGTSIAGAIAEMLTGGRWAFLDHLKGAASPEQLFQSVPGIGPGLARRVCETLQVHTLEGLEAAAHDGQLEQVKGFGHRRAAMVRAALAEMLARVRRSPLVRSEEPAVELLLDVDREYRQRVAAGELIKIAPKRFNPKREAWLPLLHTVRNGWHFTALYSNTARAHQLGRETDWVIVYFHKDNHAEGQRTVVTETRGEAAGRRIVRGREEECRTYYGSAAYFGVGRKS